MKALLFGTTLMMAALASPSALADRGNVRWGGYDGYSSSYYGRSNYGRSNYGRSNYGRGNYGRNNYGRSSGFYYGSRDNSFYSRGWNSHRGYRDRYRGSYIGFSYGNRAPYYRGRNHIDAGDFVGGLVVGSLLSSAINSNRYESPRHYSRVSRPVVRTREVVVVREPTTRPAPVASGRRLLKDLQGNCYERVVDEAGDELRIELDPDQCAF